MSLGRRFTNTAGLSAEARADFERQAERFRERQRLLAIAEEPGGRALLEARWLLGQEAGVLVAIDAATDEAERARLTRSAEELRRMADQAIRQAEVFTVMKTGHEIRERMRKRLADVAARLADVREDEDERFPPAYRIKRQAERGDLTRLWKQIENESQAEMAEWARRATAAAQALYHSDPIGDAAAESRRVAENMEIAALAEPFIGQPAVMARNRLLPEARRFVALDLPAKARIYLEAARRAGVEDGRLAHAVEQAFDRTVPHRRQAREQMVAIVDEQDLLTNDIYSTRVTHGVGSRSEQAVNSSVAKMVAWRRSQGLVPAGGGAGRGEADGGAAAE